MRKIKLTNSVEKIIVDDEDYDRTSRFKWYLVRSSKGCIIFKNLPDKITIGRFILNLDDSNFEADHKDRNSLNNQKNNLRPATHQQNMMNRGKQLNNTSGYKGVSWHKRSQKWRASLSHNNRTLHIGLFETKEEAALAYNKAVKFYHGEFAVLNILSTEE